jgi:hypothetical protein
MAFIGIVFIAFTSDAEEIPHRIFKAIWLRSITKVVVP